jgi:hypothetical protein
MKNIAQLLLVLFASVVFPAASAVAVDENLDVPLNIPYFERAVGGEYTASSPAAAEKLAWRQCQAGIVSFQRACAKLRGSFHVTMACQHSYTREYCPERCGTFGAGVSGAVRCDR